MSESHHGSNTKWIKDQLMRAWYEYSKEHPLVTPEEWYKSVMYDLVTFPPDFSKCLNWK